MTTGQAIWASLVRLARVLIAQAISFYVTELAGVNIPVINISGGAALSAVAKFLRDKYKWEWLPV